MYGVLRVNIFKIAVEKNMEKNHSMDMLIKIHLDILMHVCNTIFRRYNDTKSDKFVHFLERKVAFLIGN